MWSVPLALRPYTFVVMAVLIVILGGVSIAWRVSGSSEPATLAFAQETEAPR